MLNLTSEFGLVEITSTYTQGHEGVKIADQISASNIPIVTGNHKRSSLLPSVVPIGAPWQQIYLLARTQKKIYVELLDLAPINLTLSFSSSPWMLMNGVLTSGESVIHRGLMALADIEGAQIHLNQPLIAHQLASWESIQVILIRHYKGQFLHEMYKQGRVVAQKAQQLLENVASRKRSHQVETDGLMINEVVYGNPQYLKRSFQPEE
ncbi:hypothetical protein POM88_013765 [Heracleum sosnowskyi]|nr:hypothetical protein POM88_013765 [Heracleum sosnowskyi]